MAKRLGGFQDGNDVAPLEELEELADSVEESPVPGDDQLLDIAEVAQLAASFDDLPMAYAILSPSLEIIYKNRSFLTLLERFDYPRRQHFLSLFSSALGLENLGTIRAALRDRAGGHCWKGRLSHRVKHSATEINTVFISPFYAAPSRHGEPTVFIVFFDDITSETQNLLRSMFLSLLEASKLKDNDTGAHIQRVNLYAELLATKLYNDSRFPEVDRDFQVEIGFLAAMHDVGKIGTPDDILNKNGPLTPWEWTIMREHTINGAYILSTYPSPMAKQIALSHHEMWDGNGYPYKWQGEMIPLSARIVSIADVYDALRMKRSYKPAYPHSAAINKIRDWGGSHFDPRLIETFLAMEGEVEAIYESHQD